MSPGNTVWQHTSTRMFKQPPPAAMPSAPGVSGERRSEVPQTAYLLPPSVDEWLPQNHLARFVVLRCATHPTPPAPTALPLAAVA